VEIGLVPGFEPEDMSFETECHILLLINGYRMKNNIWERKKN
jgi:hypothetical protein